jgi:RND family efflux transporter MFP subunit
MRDLLKFTHVHASCASFPEASVKIETGGNIGTLRAVAAAGNFLFDPIKRQAGRGRLVPFLNRYFLRKPGQEMKTKNKALIVSIILCSGAGTWYVTRGHAEPANASASPSSRASKPGAGGGPVMVNVVAARKQNVPIELQANGTVVPLSTVEIRPQTSSILKKVHIREGQFVRSGDVLFTLDDRSDRANLDKAQAQLARDQATLADLERQYKRSQDLVAQKFISQGAADTVQTQVEAQRASIKSDLAALQSAQVAIGYATIRSPMAGRVGAINVFSGSLVQPGVALAGVTQIDPISVSFTVPESSVQSLLDAQKSGRVAVKATLSNPEKSLDGALSFIDSAVDPVAGTIRVKAQFDNRDTLLWPGQYVNTTVTVRTLENAVVVPLAAIVTAGSGKLVYSMEADKTAKQRPIGLIHAFGNHAAVSGLSGTEKIIVEGKQNLRSGSKILEAPTVADAGEPGKKRGARAAKGGAE